MGETRQMAILHLRTLSQQRNRIDGANGMKINPARMLTKKSRRLICRQFKHWWAVGRTAAISEILLVLPLSLCLNQ
jgi:hypothetical protein